MLPPMADHPEDALDTKDLVSALRFCHMMEMQTKLRLTDLAASFYALAETLTVQGLLPLDLYEQRLITYEDALRNADSVNDLRLTIKLQSVRARNPDLAAGTEAMKIV